MRNDVSQSKECKLGIRDCVKKMQIFVVLYYIYCLAFSKHCLIISLERCEG